jgi:hypothetical protein
MGRGARAELFIYLASTTFTSLSAMPHAHGWTLVLVYTILRTRHARFVPCRRGPLTLTLL